MVAPAQSSKTHDFVKMRYKLHTLTDAPADEILLMRLSSKMSLMFEKRVNTEKMNFKTFAYLTRCIKLVIYYIT